MELLTVRETAEILKVNPITVRRYISAGQLPAVRVGKGIRVHKEAVEKLMRPVDREPKRAGPIGRVLTYEDPIWKLVGSARSAEPTDASRKHEYLAGAWAQRKE